MKKILAIAGIVMCLSSVSNAYVCRWESNYGTWGVGYHSFDVYTADQIAFNNCVVASSYYVGAVCYRVSCY